MTSTQPFLEDAKMEILKYYAGFASKMTLRLCRVTFPGLHRQKYTTSFFIWNVGFMWDIVCYEIFMWDKCGIVCLDIYL